MHSEFKYAPVTSAFRPIARSLCRASSHTSVALPPPPNLLSLCAAFNVAFAAAFCGCVAFAVALLALVLPVFDAVAVACLLDAASEARLFDERG